MISQALAAHFVPASESPAEAIALSVILGAAVVLFLAYLGLKRWRRRSRRDDGDGLPRDP